MGEVTDRNDPRLGRGVDEEPGVQHAAHLVLPADERERGFVRPVRKEYKHTVCGGVTTMSQGIAETYARQPSFYGSTYCVKCSMYRPVGEDGEFEWLDGTKVGT